MSKVKKGNKGSKNVKNNVIPFKSKKLETIKNVTPMDKQEVETARVNDYAKEVCKNLDDFASNAGIDVERFYYNFLFYIKQAVIMKLSYPAFKYLDKGSTEEVTQNHSDFLAENCPELSLAKQESDTIH
tara:strand:+ start:194 stop:580 length:387 start_codon:yes stop_codon:yes gene_type:complete